MSDEWDDLFDLDEDEDLDQTSSLVDDFQYETDFFEEEEEEGGLNRSFLLAGLLLIATFVVIIIAIILLVAGQSDEEANANATATAIAGTNFAVQTSRAQTSTQIAMDVQGTREAELTATFIAEQTAFAAGTQTWDAFNRFQTSTVDAIIANRTNTAVANQTFAAMTATFLTLPPTATPTEPPPLVVSGALVSADGQPVEPGTVIRIYRDDGDGVFNPPPTPTPMPTPSRTPSPTVTMTSAAPPETPTPTSAIDTGPRPTESPGDGELSPADIAATNDAIARATQAAAFDATSTARAERRNTPVGPAPTTPPPADTIALTQLAVGGNNLLSVSIPANWQFSDRLDNQGAFFFGDSAEAIESRAALFLDAPPPKVGLGGQIVPQTLSAVGGVSEATPELLEELLQSWIEITEESGGQIISDPVNVEGDGFLLRYAVLLQGNEQGFLAYLGFEESVAFVTVTGTIDTFEANRDLLFAILQSVRMPAASEAEGLVNEEALRAVPRRSRPLPIRSGVFQPTPGPGEDIPIGEIVIGEDGTFILRLPPEPDTYYIEIDLTPGNYILNIEGRDIPFTVPETGSDQVIIALTDRTVILVVNAVEEDEVVLVTATPTITPTFDVGDGSSSFFLTATAVARTRVPQITLSATMPGPTVTAIPQTGLFSSEDGGMSPGQLTLLALIGAALMGVVFVVRRLRTAV